LKEHPFFSGIDWAKLERREVKPPFTPQAYSVAYDKSYLEHLAGQMTPTIEEMLSAGSASKTHKDICHFKGFSFRLDE
jgi:hypothetical protein